MKLNDQQTELRTVVLGGRAYGTPHPSTVAAVLAFLEWDDQGLCLSCGRHRENVDGGHRPDCRLMQRMDRIRPDDFLR